MNYYCAECGALAGRVELIGSGRLRVSGFIGVTEESVDESLFRKLLSWPDPRALWEHSPLSAPFYCPQCNASYCSSHWTIVEVFDEDFPSHYDCSRGYCPAGHSRLIED